MDESQAAAAGPNTEPGTGALSGLKFSKGHGTGNDFVLIADPDGALSVTPGQVAALCDRHRGIGDQHKVVARAVALRKLQSAQGCGAGFSVTVSGHGQGFVHAPRLPVR